MDSEVIADFHSLYQLGFGWFGSKDKQLVILRRLLASQDPEICPWLLSGAFSRNKVLATKSREVIGLLMRAIPVSQLARLEYKLGPRYSHYGISNQFYSKLEPGSLSTINPRADVHVLGLASLHPKGRLREAACRLLGIEGLRYLLLRLNDWVPQVRNAARAVLDDLIGESPQIWVDCLPLLCRLESCGRDKHGPFLERVDGSLRNPRAKAAVTAGLQSENLIVARRCFVLAMNHADPFEILTQALVHNDMGVRYWAVGVAPKSLPLGQQREFFERALVNKVPAVRRSGLRFWGENFPHSEETMKSALLDRSRAVREVAQYYCREWEREIVYREKLQVLPQAVVGLAEVGCKDQEHALAILEHKDPRFRKSALRALAMLGADVAYFFQALLSENPGISKVAASCLVGTQCDPGRFEALYRQSELEHVRVQAFVLFWRLSRPWPKLCIAG